MEGNRYPRFVPGAGITTNKRRYTDVQSFAKTARALVPPLELKWRDHEVANFTTIQQNETAINVNANVDPPTTNCLNGVAEGDGPERRKGRQILIKSLQIKGVVQWETDFGSTLVNPTDHVYVAVILDTQTNDALMRSFDCFERCPPHLSAIPFRRLESGNRFRILKSWTLDNMPRDSAAWVLEETIARAESAETRKLFEGFIPLNIITHFDGNTDNCLEIDDNSIHVVAYSSTDLLTAKISYKSRIRFTDG